MNSYSRAFRIMGLFFFVVIFGVIRVDGMLNLDDGSGTLGLEDDLSIPLEVLQPVPVGSLLDQRVMTDLGTLGGKPIKAYLMVLSSILSYVGGELVSPDVQLVFSNIVVKFDKYARRAIRTGVSVKDKVKIASTKKQIYEIDKFLKNLQNSSLLHLSIANYVSTAIQYWDDKTKKCGLSPYQMAIQRQKKLKKQRR